MEKEERKIFLKTIGKRIRDLRKERELSQDALSKLCGYSSRSTINKIEMGINDISQSKLQKIAEVLNVTPAYLIGQEPRREIELSETEKEIISRYRSADHITKEMVLRALELDVKLKKENCSDLSTGV